MSGGFDTPFEQTRQQLREDEEQQAQDPTTNTAQEASQRQFKIAKRRAVQKAKQVAQKQTEKVVQRLAMRGTLRTIALGSAATGVGLVVTFIIWTVQIFAGNLMGSKWIPPLELWEIVAWGIVAGILVLFTLVIVAILEQASSNPLIKFTSSIVSSVIN